MVIVLEVKKTLQISYTALILLSVFYTIAGFKTVFGTSLVGQWIGIRLLMPGMWV